MKKLIVVKVGSPERPATPEDIEDAKKNWAALIQDPELMLVTHHAFSVEVFQIPKGCLTIFKLGDDDYPAIQEDIQELMKEITIAYEEKRPVFTHHAVKVEIVQL